MSKRLPHAMVIDGNVAQRHQIVVALASLYQVHGYPDVETAIALTRKPPAVLILDEGTRLHDRRDLIRAIRAEPHYRETRIVICRTKRQKKTSDNINHYLDSQPDVILEKPYRRSELLEAVSGALNKKVEGGWERLPKRAKEALRNSLKFYSGMIDLMKRGDPLEFGELSNVCAPILDSVQKFDHKVLLDAVREHDNLTFVHAVRVSTLLTLFGHTIGLKRDKLEILTCGALVHDLGKSSIPQEVLNKVEPLTPEEKAMVRGHVHATANYLRQHSNLPKGILTIAELHHERLDGSGYPYGLKAEDQNDLARMAAVVDVFVGLTDRRPYRVPKDVDTALKIMKEDMADQLDQRLLTLFTEVLKDATSNDWT
jgi:HD-GYP domain-containing protein (c-di-GMP phosphodiesterase class II)